MYNRSGKCMVSEYWIQCMHILKICKGLCIIFNKQQKAAFFKTEGTKADFILMSYNSVHFN